MPRTCRKAVTVADEDFVAELEEHLDLLHNLCRRLVRTRPEAEDLLQETSLRALRGWRSRRPDDVRAWLVTICLNTARSGWRRDAGRPLVSLDSQDWAALPGRDDPEAEAIAGTVREDVHQALWRLPAPQREAIALMDLCGFTAAEVSTMIGAPRGTVLARAHRGHKRLATLLQAHGGAAR